MWNTNLQKLMYLKNTMIVCSYRSHAYRDPEGKVNAASFAICVRVHHEPTCIDLGLTEHFRREPFLSWHAKGFNRHLLQTGRKRDPRASDAPTIFELMDQHKITEISRRAVEVLTTAAELAQKEGWSEVRSCNPTLRCLTLYFLEFSAHRRVMDSQVRGDLLQPIPMLAVRLGDPGFSILGKDLLQCRLDWL